MTPPYSADTTAQRDCFDSGGKLWYHKGQKALLNEWIQIIKAGKDRNYA